MSMNLTPNESNQKAISHPRFAVMAIYPHFLDTYFEMLHIDVPVLRTPSAVIDAANSSDGKFVLLTHLPSDNAWKRTLPSFACERVDELIKLNHPDAQVRHWTACKQPVKRETFEAEKHFYKQLLNDFAHVELQIFTHASPDDFSEGEILALGAPGRIKIRHMLPQPKGESLAYCLTALRDIHPYFESRIAIRTGNLSAFERAN